MPQELGNIPGWMLLAAMVLIVFGVLRYGIEDHAVPVGLVYLGVGTAIVICATVAMWREAGVWWYMAMAVVAFVVILHAEATMNKTPTL